MQEEDRSGSFDDVVNIGDYQPASTFERQLQEYKVKLAMAAVRENNGNKTLAARRLGISRAYLHRLIRVAEPETATLRSGRPPLRHGLIRMFSLKYPALRPSWRRGFLLRVPEATCRKQLLAGSNCTAWNALGTPAAIQS